MKLDVCNLSFSYKDKIVLNKKISKEELDNIIKLCRIDKINIVKSMGLEAMIINNSCISGGEKNRIILARSLIHSKNILILDEILKKLETSMFDLNINKLVKKDLYGLELTHNISFSKIYSRNIRNNISKL